MSPGRPPVCLASPRVSHRAACVVRALGTRVTRCSGGPRQTVPRSCPGWWATFHPPGILLRDRPQSPVVRSRESLQTHFRATFTRYLVPPRMSQTRGCRFCDRSRCRPVLGPTVATYFIVYHFSFCLKIFTVLFPVPFIHFIPSSTCSSMLIFDFYVKPLTVRCMVY